MDSALKWSVTAKMIAANANTVFNAIHYQDQTKLVAYAASNTVLIMDPFQRLPHAQKDMAAPRVLFALNAHTSRVNAVQWISPSSLVSIGGDEKLIAVWRCEPGHEREPEMWKAY